MVWSHKSGVELSGSDVTVEQLWKVWSNIPLMATYDPDVHRSRTDKGVSPAPGVPIYITLKSDPNKENMCMITKWQPPVDGDNITSVALHYDLKVPLGLLSFQYNANLDKVQNLVTLTVGTEVSGLFGPVYAGLFKNTIINGCEHMVKSVPKLASSID